VSSSPLPAMAIIAWQKVVSAGKSEVHDGIGGVLVLHSCSLVACSAEVGAALYCKVGQQERLVLARPTAAKPHALLRTRVTEAVTLSSEGGDIFVSGVVLPAEGIGTTEAEPPAKRLRVEAAPAAVQGKEAAGVVNSSNAAAASDSAKSKVPDQSVSQPRQNGKPDGGSSAGANAACTPKEEQATQVKNFPSKVVGAVNSSTAAAASDSAKRKVPEQSVSQPRQDVKVDGGSGSGAKAVSAPNQAQATQSKNVPSKAERKKNGNQAAPVAKRQLPSGLNYEVLKAGSGPQAQRGKNVQVRYDGRLVKSGSRFDKGIIKFRLGLGEVIRGWDEGVLGMLRGERRRLLVPARLGYGSRGAPPAIPANADLVFDVELVAC